MMSEDELGHRKHRSLIPLILVSWFSPLIAIEWGFLRLMRFAGWKRALIILSAFGNLLFASVLVIGYLESANPCNPIECNVGEPVASDCIQRCRGPLRFCEHPPESDLSSALPNSIYVASTGTIRARFQFADEELISITDVMLCDGFGRPWIEVNIEDGSMIYSRYADDVAADPTVSLRDKDGDGIPDIMINWELTTSFERDQNLSWRRISRD